MSKDKSQDFINIDEARRLIKDHLNVMVSRAGIYRYIKTKNFPDNIGIGTPRVWRRSDVMSWIEGFLAE